MKIDKAIEILELDLTWSYPACFDDLQDAIKLGREALKRHGEKDHLTYNGMLQPLPGEDSIENKGLSDDRLNRLKESPLGRES